jgi:isopenicillin-N epimerase
MRASASADYLLDPDVAYLNHGSFGACPRGVFDVYQEWQRELERNPVDFLDRRRESLLATARDPLAAFLGVQPDAIALVRNATTGLGAVIRSLRLGPGDEVLATTHEYGALVKNWDFVGVRLRCVEPEEIPQAFGEETKVLFTSHVTSATARVLPVADWCALAAERGVLSIVDGAHAPGLVPLDLRTIGCDVYAGNCHKWLSAPKGSAFLFVREEHRRVVEPPVVSWGWEPGADLQAKVESVGTADPAAWLAIPAAIEAWRTTDFAYLSGLAARAKELLPPAYPDCAERLWVSEIDCDDTDALSDWLFAEHRIVVPCTRHGSRPFVRVSIAPYNELADVETLRRALVEAGALT